jgi:hypothetical protein
METLATISFFRLIIFNIQSYLLNQGIINLKRKGFGLYGCLSSTDALKVLRSIWS